MLCVSTSPMCVKAGLKRSLDRETGLVQEKKKPRYVGTIYEAMLAPLAPCTTLPLTRLPPRTQPQGDPRLQDDLNDLVRLGKREEVEEWLDENSHKVNLNLYSVEGLTPLQEVCQEGGEGSMELARLLVRYGADTRLASRDGWSLVHMASFSGNSSLLLFLLSCRS